VCVQVGGQRDGKEVGFILSERRGTTLGDHGEVLGLREGEQGELSFIGESQERQILCGRDLEVSGGVEWTLWKDEKG